MYAQIYLNAIQTVTVQVPKNESSGFVNNQQEQWRFKFDKILHNSSQEDVFDHCARDIVKSVIEGFNGTVMVYGQTGAGKTFTMNGSTQNYKYRGVIPRAITQVFQEIGSRFEQEFTVKVSYLEIYNELMFDLISPVPTHEQGGNQISIQDDAKGEIHVKGLTLNVVKNEEEALNFLFEGETNRTVSAHQLNKESSRSHCIYTIHLESKSRLESTEKVVFSRLHLVDLAGSERTKKSGAQGINLKEATYINKSLSFLEQVVVSVCDNKREHIPYRQSKLTNFLKNSIGGNCQTIMIANIYPEPDHVEETISTLKFATRMMKVSNEPIVNVQQDPQLLLKKYEKEIRDLKQELAMHDTLANKGRVQYDPYTAEQQYEIQKLAQQFMDGEVEDIEELNSMRQVKELFAQMKNIFRKLEHDAKNIEARSEGLGGQRQPTQLQDIERRKTMMNSDGVGDLDDIGEFGLGIAPRNLKPVNKIELSKKKEEEIARMQADDDNPPLETEPDDEADSKLEMMRLKKQREAKRKPIDRQQAFIEFKNLPDGRQFEDQILNNRQELKDKKVKVKVLTEQCNNTKKEIDTIKAKLDEKAEEKKKNLREDIAGIDDDDGQGGNGEVQQEIIDEEELSYLQKMKEMKKKYRENYDLLKSLRGEVYYVQQSIDSLKQQLVSQFEDWYTLTFDDDETLSQGGQQKSGRTLQQSTKLIQKQNFIEVGDDEQERREGGEDQEGGIDPDALAFIKAKRKVDDLHKAKKQEKKIQ
ncbi:kinesin motor domain-containing protein [Stylonychia lemnae]|uniref:Kinesin-like protein n=1 Tax=Stylonychia lemnae TaxID=5949 RepID=A0A078AXA8_STYLE|nr:kinesin motor domain-containing protein [Stylonychia lemnae]|eukprot:CDW85408.1 kinesin motor domain-containing protein [Stylonychia lemnae]